jgi:hypothetical protein
VGLVVSPYVLARYDVALDRRLSVERQARLKQLIEDETGRVNDFLALTRNLLEWPEGLLAGAPGRPPLPDSLTIALPEYEDTPRAHICDSGPRVVRSVRQRDRRDIVARSRLNRGRRHRPRQSAPRRSQTRRVAREPARASGTSAP